MASPIVTPGKCATVGLLAGLGLAAISGAVGAEGSAATAGVLGWLGGVGGNQFQSWFGSKVKEPPPDAEEVFRNHHIRALLGRAIVAAVERKAVWVRKERGNASDLFRDAGEILAVRIGELVDDPSGSFAEFREYHVISILDDFVSNKGKVNVLTLELWAELLDETSELDGLTDIERADLVGGLHEGFGEALWGLFKHDAATDRQAFASVELLYLSRILQAVQAIPGTPSVDLSVFMGRIGVLLRSVKEQQVLYFVQILGDISAVNQAMSVHTKLLREILSAVTAPKAPTFGMLHTLPPPPAAFTGRDKELEDLRNLGARGGAIITGLKGMGGIGKTALALVLAQEWASRFPDAALMLDGKGLSGDGAPSAVKLMEQVILAFHPEVKLPDDPGAVAGIYHGVLHSKKVLILLDNAKDAVQAKPLLPPSGCTLIVTSRTGFAIDGCAPYAIGRMKDAEAEVFLRGAYPKLTNAEVAELIRLCAGLPLALKLVASHLALDAADRGGTADVAEYMRRLGDGRLANLDAQADSSGEVTISETLRVSLKSLPSAEQGVWEKLGVFASDFESQAAKVIAGATEEMLGHFLRRSLLEAAGVGRYRLHDLACDYARNGISKEQKDGLTLAHAQYYQAVAESAEGLYLKGEVLSGLAIFDRERTQIEAAFAAVNARSDQAAAWLVVRLVRAVAYVGDLRFHVRQRIAWLTAQLRAARCAGSRKEEGDALGNLGVAYKNLGDLPRAIEYYKAQLECHREVGHRRGEGAALGNLGVAYISQGDTLLGIQCFEQHLEISHAIDNRRGVANALGNLGNAYSMLGNSRAAIEYHEQALIVSREIGDRRGEGEDLCSLGNAYFALGDSRAAMRYYNQQLVISREIGDRRGEGNALWSLALVFESDGERFQAISMASEALQIFEAVEDPSVTKVSALLVKWKESIR